MTGERGIMRLNELNRLLRVERRTKGFTSSGRVMHLSSILIQDELSNHVKRK